MDQPYSNFTSVRYQNVRHRYVSSRKHNETAWSPYTLNTHVLSSTTIGCGRSGVRHADWIGRIARGEVVAGPRSLVQCSGRLTWRMSDELIRNDTGLDLRGDTVYSHFPVVSDPVLTDHEARANLSYYDELADALRSWESLTTLVEADKTLLMVKSGLEKLRGYTQSFIRRFDRQAAILRRQRRRLETENFNQRNFGRPRSVTVRQVRRSRKRLSEIYLTYTYGVKPLISDCNAAFDALTSTFVPVRSIHGEFSRTHSVNRVYAMQFLTACGATASAYFDYQCDATIGVTGLFRVSPETMSRFGLDTLGMSLAAWERVPFSFVVDYFYKVGSYIQARQLFSIHPEKLCVASLRRFRFKGRPLEIIRPQGPSISSYVVRHESQEGSGDLVRFTRAIHPQNIPPRLVEFPPLAELGFWKSLNLLALGRALSRRSQVYKALVG